MEKLNKKEIKEIKEKLKSYWRRYLKIHKNFLKKQRLLEKEMTQKLDLGIDLEFFYVDNECVGIGAEDYSKRKNFPLFQYSIFE